MITQHSGDGKANQYFLRGFNLDDGTDLATSVDGSVALAAYNVFGSDDNDITYF